MEKTDLWWRVRKRCNNHSSFWCCWRLLDAVRCCWISLNKVNGSSPPKLWRLTEHQSNSQFCTSTFVGVYMCVCVCVRVCTCVCEASPHALLSFMKRSWKKSRREKKWPPSLTFDPLRPLSTTLKSDDIRVRRLSLTFELTWPATAASCQVLTRIPEESVKKLSKIHERMPKGSHSNLNFIFWNKQKKPTTLHFDRYHWGNYELGETPNKKMIQDSRIWQGY